LELGLFAKSQTDIQTRLASAIYLPERPGEGKRHAVERRHNIIIADKQNLFQAMPENYFNIKSAPLLGCRLQGSVSDVIGLYCAAPHRLSISRDN
jgi:hypothetical protein